MAYFLYGYHVLFWKPQFDYLKIADPSSKVSGHASRYVYARAFAFHLNLIKLNMAWSIESEFQQLISEKNLHNDNEKKLLYNSLPSQLLEDTHQKFDKNFTKQ